ncbi:hypothetical protein [Krasilnikovia sp. MM14-A1004]|uniref:Cap15 family cyclic dinucleotide receptor domain-containing protein n=1 Tax=Krasilnikovia sp. MM14-A1004 TaxID=3373541 RepID=UPI00399C7334
MVAVHPYSHDSGRTRIVLLALAAGSILLAWGLGRALDALDVEPPWWLDTPAVVGFYGILWQLYDRLLWRLPIGPRTLSGIADYRGIWDGHLHSSYNGGTEVEASLTIRQTSSRILVEMGRGQSGSFSRMAMLCGEPGSERGLQYLYTNRPHNEPREPEAGGVGVIAMTIHEGVSRLLLSEDGTTLTGDYQNDRHRQTYGTMSFTRR